MKTVALVGNPNCGKTTVFNALTGADQTVGNWPGVTVELKRGTLRLGDESVCVVDLPGIYSFSAASLDEKIARDFILKEQPDLVVNVLDAANLERNLYLTVQLIEMKIPCLVLLNMMDEVKRRQLAIDVKSLASLLDVCVVTASAHQGIGMDDLSHAIGCSLKNPAISSLSVHYPDELETEILRIQAMMHKNVDGPAFDPRWVGLKLLEGDEASWRGGVSDGFKDEIHRCRTRLRSIYGEDVDMLMADSRYGLVHAMVQKTVDRSRMTKFDVSDLIDRVALHRFLGIPFFLGIMYLVFWMTINLGGCFIDFFDMAAGAFFVDLPTHLFSSINVPSFLINLLCQGVGGGIQTVATFIPPIFFMFLSLAILDDSGYMARAAFVMDRAMRFLGLPGKAFVPLLVGFGCNVPAILATRTLEDKNDRIITIMMNPLMSCGARLPIYALFAIAFFPQSGGLVIFMLYLVGVFMAALTALLLRKTLFPGEGSPFIMEIPPYHVPTLKGILLHTWQRLKGFILKAGQAIVLVVVVLTLLNSVSWKGVSSSQSSAQVSILSGLGKLITPVFKPLGIRDDNWPASVGVVTGIMFKESVIATLDSLYTQSNDDTQSKDVPKGVALVSSRLDEAWASVGKNLSKLRPPFVVGKVPDLNENIAEYHVQKTTYEALRSHFDGKAGAFAFLLLILLYMPCLSAVGAVYQELGLRWTVFSVGYLSILAWSVATLFYQLARFSQNPGAALVWIFVVVFLFSAIIVFLKTKGASVLKVTSSGKRFCRSGCSSCASCH